MDVFNWIGFAASIGVYFLTLLVVSFSRNKNSVHWMLIALLVAGTFWSSVQLISRFFPLYDTYIFIAESIRLSFLILFLAALINNKKKVWQIFLNKINLTFLMVAIFVPFANFYSWLPKSSVFIAYLAGTVLALVLMEILFKKARQELWQLKPLMFGLLTLLIFDFIVLAEASLLSTIDQDMWLARGYLHALFIPLLLLSLKRTKNLGIDVFISRDMIFQSSLLVAAGGYLMVMAVVGYYIKSVEAQWSSLTQILFLVLAFTFLIALLISDDLKKRFKVFIQKNFFANRFDYREQWLLLTKTIGKELSDNETVYQRAILGFCQSVNYEKACLIKITGQHCEVVAHSNLALTEDELALCRTVLIPYADNKRWIIDMHEYSTSVQNYPGLIIPYSIVSNLSFQAVVPIFNGDSLWGVCLLDSAKEHISFNWEIRDYMSVVAMQLGNYILQSEANKVLTENAQFAAFNRTSAFVVHDLKNVLAQIRLILSNAEKFKHNPEFIDDTFETLQHTDSRMQKMLDQLMSKQSHDNTDSQYSIEQIITQQVLPKTHKLQPNPELDVHSDFPIHLDAEKFSNVLFHLIDNAQHATADDGHIKIEIEIDGQWGIIKITDSGTGMTQDFINHSLFRPFVTTKGNAGMGIGAYDAKLYIESLGGKISVTSELGSGSEFIIALPLDK